MLLLSLLLLLLQALCKLQRWRAEVINKHEEALWAWTLCLKLFAETPNTIRDDVTFWEGIQVGRQLQQGHWVGAGGAGESGVCVGWREYCSESTQGMTGWDDGGQTKRT